jgi:DNA-directed RNA polymerase subunit alpha
MGTALKDSHEIKDSVTAQRYLEAGRKAEAAGDRVKAIEAYEAAFAADPDDADVCFRLAYSLDLVGEEEEAIHLYEQCIQQPQPPLNALINLAVLYEDREEYAKAERCVRQVLATNPTHPRATLYIKDIVASRNAVVEDDHEGRPGTVQPALLDTPVTDFELTVRTRNALRKMNIRTLADLLRVTEAELRSYKNFGESSLDEIKRMLAQRGLKLGQAAEAQQSAAQQAVYDKLKSDTGDDEALARSVNELQLSVRARKALALLNVHAIGDLCMKTEAELMGVKNFGMTSLLEIKQKLGEMGLSLRELQE